MKVEIEEKTEFNPFEIKITVESRAELVELWTRFNATPNRFNECLYKGEELTTWTGDLWLKINDKLLTIDRKG